jgi:RNA polymerase sigma factor (sigma-70 family)
VSFEKMFPSHPRLSLEQETKLVLEYQAGDNKAADTIIRAHANYIMSIVRSRCPNPVEAEEVFANMSLDILEALQKFDVERGNRLTTYLGHVVYKRMGRNKEGSLQETLIESDTINTHDGMPDALTDSINSEFFSHVYDFLNVVPAETRWIIHCRQEGISFKQIAKELTIRRGTTVTIEELKNVMKMLQNDLLSHLRSVGMCDREFVGDVFSRVIDRPFD